MILCYPRLSAFIGGPNFFSITLLRQARRPSLIASPEFDLPSSKEDVDRCFTEFREPLYRYLRTLGSRHARAEEITQEAFLRLVVAQRDGAQIQDMRAWVFRVARNLCIDDSREDQRFWSTAGAPPLPFDHRGVGSDPEQQMLRREQMRMIVRDLPKLSEVQRECLRLRVRGLRYRQIAAALGISLTSAVDAVRQAVKRLRRRLDE